MIRIVSLIGALASLLICARTAEALQDSKLDLRRTDSQLHVMTSFAGSLFITEYLEWHKVPTWESTLIATAIMGTAGVVKEYAFDSFASGSDLMANGIGLGGNVFAQATIHFSWTGSDLWIFNPAPVRSTSAKP